MGNGGWMGVSSNAIDREMMARCVWLGSNAVTDGEYPFGSVIAIDGQIIAEATNRTARDNDVSRHAEVLALSLAQQSVGRSELSRATLYSNVEPCAMCSYCIREAWVGRVVYALKSPIMGGASKWNILRDDDLSTRVPIFGPAPEVVSGVLAREAKEAWRAWSPLPGKWCVFAEFLVAEEESGKVDAPETVQVLKARPKSPWQHAFFAFMKLSKKGKNTPRGS